MSLVTFQDLPNTTTPINAANLNNNFSELDSEVTGDVLFENSSGSASNIQFINTGKTYKKLEIHYFGVDRGSGQIAVCDPKINNSIVLVAQGFSSETTRHYIYTTKYTVSSTGLTIAANRLTTIYVSSLSNSNDNGISITKVIGYE